MGYVLLAPLVKEVIKTDKSLDHCQAAITHLTKAGTICLLYIMRHIFVVFRASLLLFCL